VPLQVSDAAGARDGSGHVTELTRLSETLIPEIVVVPVLVTT